jgi:hypothetical protein
MSLKFLLFSRVLVRLYTLIMEGDWFSSKVSMDLLNVLAR